MDAARIVGNTTSLIAPITQKVQMLTPSESAALAQTMVGQAALIELLISKGIVSHGEIQNAIQTEVDRLNSGAIAKRADDENKKGPTE